MKPFGFVEPEIPVYSVMALTETLVGIQVDVLVLQRPAQPLDIHVVQRPTAEKTVAVTAVYPRIVARAISTVIFCGPMVVIASKPALY